MKDIPLLVSVTMPLQLNKLNNSMGQYPSDDESSPRGQEIINRTGNVMNHYIMRKILRWALALDRCFQSTPGTLIRFYINFKMMVLSTSCKRLYFLDQII
jgi:hypothetical protein